MGVIRSLLTLCNVNYKEYNFIHLKFCTIYPSPIPSHSEELLGNGVS
ncbi:hypothetical protein GYH30_032206 [Glycine max]|nr:hypothetical protein GYH30_032206 [Glycine max]